MYKSLIILLGSLLLTAACGSKGKPSAEPKLAENKESSPKGGSPEDTGAKGSSPEGIGAKVEQLKEHRLALAQAGISQEQITELFRLWKLCGSYQVNRLKRTNKKAGPLHTDNIDEERKKHYLTIKTALPSLTDLIKKKDLDAHNAAATVQAITKQVSYQALKEAAEAFLKIAKENDGENFFNESNGKGRKGDKGRLDWQGYYPGTQQAFIDYMNALQAFAEAALF